MTLANVKVCGDFLLLFFLTFRLISRSTARRRSRVSCAARSFLSRISSCVIRRSWALEAVTTRNVSNKKRRQRKFTLSSRHRVGRCTWPEPQSLHSSTCAVCDGDDKHIMAGTLNGLVWNSLGLNLDRNHRNNAMIPSTAESFA